METLPILDSNRGGCRCDFAVLRGTPDPAKYRNAVRSATAQAVHEHFAGWYHLLAGDAELSQVVVSGLRDQPPRSRKCREPGSSQLSLAFLSYSQNAFLKWRQGLLAPPLWQGWELLIMNLVSSPGGKSFWKERGYLFGDEFREHVEGDLMKRKPHPDAKPMGAFNIGPRAGDAS